MQLQKMAAGLLWYQDCWSHQETIAINMFMQVAKKTAEKAKKDADDKTAAAEKAAQAEKVHSHVYVFLSLSFHVQIFMLAMWW